MAESIKLNENSKKIVNYVTTWNLQSLTHSIYKYFLSAQSPK